MVRRWSYINSLNSRTLDSFEHNRLAAFDSSVNATMYLRKQASPITLLRRRRWARRKHLHNWLYSLNVLKDWASVYRFYRTYAKYVFNQYLLRHSFLAFNIVRSKNSIPCLHKGAESVVSSLVTRRIIRYFQLFNNPRLSFLGKFTHLNLVSISVPLLTSESIEDLSGSFASVPLLGDSPRTFSELSAINKTNTRNGTAVVSHMFATRFRIWVQSVVSLYRFLVLLTIKRVVQ